jgi:hypothetical protein
MFTWIKKYLARNNCANESKSTEQQELVMKGDPLIPSKQRSKQPSHASNNQLNDKPSYNTSAEFKDKLTNAVRIQTNAENGLMFDTDMPPTLTEQDCHSKAEEIILNCLTAVKKNSQVTFDQEVAGENGRYINIYHEMGAGFMQVESLLRNFEPSTHKIPDALNAFYVLTIDDKNNGPVKRGDHLGAGAGAMMDFCNALQKIIDNNDYNK